VAVAGVTPSTISTPQFNVVGSDCFEGVCPHGGDVTLAESMEVTTEMLLIDGSLANGSCGLPLRPGDDPVTLSFHTPPQMCVCSNSKLTTINVAMYGAAGLTVQSSQPLNVSGNWQNNSVRPDCFDADTGILRLNGGTLQSFEVAATDSGGTGATSVQFHIGTLEVAANAQVTLRDDFDNDLQGLGPCGEAQYVDTLVLEAGSTLTAQDCRLYYGTLVKDPSAQIAAVGCGEIRSANNPLAASADPTGITKSRTSGTSLSSSPEPTRMSSSARAGSSTCGRRN